MNETPLPLFKEAKESLDKSLSELAILSHRNFDNDIFPPDLERIGEIGFAHDLILRALDCLHRRGEYEKKNSSPN